MTGSSSRVALRERLRSGELIVAPGVFDGISASLVARLGFANLLARKAGLSRVNVGRFDIATGDYSNETTGASGHAPPLPPLILEIIESGGILPRLAEQGYLPAELRDVLRSGTIPTDGSGA
jgi:hypothetical protein